MKATLLLPLLLASCQAEPEAKAPPPPPPLVQAKPGASGLAPAMPAGLTPLPSAQQVVTAQPVGRADPFLPVVSAAPAGSRPGASVAPSLPSGFSFHGVIRSGGQSQALVQFGTESGALVPGDVGGRSTKLLPPGWAVGGIDVARGLLILRASGRAVPVSLDGQT